MNKQFKTFELRVKTLPYDYQIAWQEIKSNFWEYSDFSGRNLMPIFEGIIGLLEETAADGKTIGMVLGKDIKSFCSDLIEEESGRSWHNKCRNQLNSNIAKKLGKYEYKMSIKDIIKEKKEWRAHMARVKMLPKDYQIVYKEIQKYFYKVGTIELSEGIDLLIGIVDLFEQGVASEKGVLEVTGSDVAAFCDDLIKD